ncbi:lysophospholipase [Phragmitibacter flavus]|uniref:Lysophospholipase n=1 Tax=Phragmitibacter flavus TaxID=2576071 RepID=A0A5R8KFX8_9BACT|nr:alpha/beta fold hydrolase [Phragmitibacter flavus]TLD70865.1 lysophospholipase [Phragmitibacter flavus]
MNPKLRRMALYLGLGLSAILLLASTVIWWAAGEIVHPPRRPLQDYHHAILNSPQTHGLVIKPFEVAGSSPGDFATPVLLCEPDPQAQPGPRGQLLRQQLTDLGQQLKPFGEITATLVLLHGRKGRKEDNLPVAERLCAAGFRCLLIDLPAHGENLNPIASYGLHEWKLPDLIETTAAAHFQYPSGPRALWGISQGGAVAIQAAAKTPWDALIVIASFAQFEDICRGQSDRLFGPASTLMFTLLKPVVEFRGGYQLGDITPINSARQLTLPAMIGHGTADTLIPIEIGQQLFDAVPSAHKEWRRIETGTHDRVLVTPMPLYADMANFYLSHLQR